MAQDRAASGGSRWQEWVIVLSIAALAVIGVVSIWGGSIRRWVQSSAAERSESTSQEHPAGAAGSRL
jgi:hypothetical protein